MLRTDLRADDLAGVGVGPFEIEATPDQLRAWRGRPTAAFLIRAFVFLAPIAVALLVTLLLIRLVPPPDHGTGRLAWWLGLTAAALLVVMIGDRIARQLLPLAALLKLSLVFPDQAPSRFSVALRTGTTRQLAQRLKELREPVAMGGDAVLPDVAAHGESTVDPAGAAELLALVAALNVHDHVTRGHSERVRALSDMIAAELGLSAADRDRLRWAALLHDIGKLTIPAEILNKTGRPTAAEWRIIATHPAEGERLIAGPLAEWLGEWGRAIGEHHEQFDGSGYPRGLMGAEISLAGRLVAVADAFDVITSHRSYKRPLSAAEARAEITACAGSHFDPVIVRAFLQVSVGRLRRTAGPLTWLAQIPLLGNTLFVAPSVSASAAATGAVAAVTVGAISFTPSFVSPIPVPTETATAKESSAASYVVPAPIVSPNDARVVVVDRVEVLRTTPAEIVAVPIGAAASARLADSLRTRSAPVVEVAPTVLTSDTTAAPVVVESAPADADPAVLGRDVHRAAIRDRLLAMHGDCAVSGSPPAGGRGCGRDQPAATTETTSTAALAAALSSAPAAAPPAGQAVLEPAPGEASGPPGQTKVAPGRAKKD